MPPIETQKNENPSSAHHKLEIELSERYEDAPNQIADAARLWIVEAIERRVYSHGLTNAQVDTTSLKRLKEKVDCLNRSLGHRSQQSVDRFLKPPTYSGQKLWIHLHLLGLPVSSAAKRLDEAFRNTFRYVVYPVGQYLKEVNLLDFPIDEEDALTRDAEIVNFGWIPVCAPEPRLAVQEELTDGLVSLNDLARQIDALNKKNSAEAWLKAWKELNSKALE
ncbi:hypothetical protein RAS12_11940 [Achromobacter seleniivolatilans]|uniref:Uncharacterized protein n=1 Tax=Achromobacter seleniivolatilans TaxID=3047478 RepID=A0ABY9M7S3_9BURK|nr:hypothetical protein [Achromobacter sp. R39]WMD23048.1 hypothetical protein RAS12_11940 [Achromobacter sp. R39]